MIDRARNAADHLAIASLVNRYAAFVRHGQADRLGELFTDDATYDIREADASLAANAPVLRRRIVGREAIGAYLAGTTGGGVRVVPLIHNLLIALDGDRATATSVNEARTWPRGCDFIGEYEDRFRRRGNAWLFASRCFTMFLPGPPVPA